MKRQANEITKGFGAGLPIVMGYIPVGIAFGVLASNTGVSLIHTQLFSLMVFAGASQFMAINLIALGVGMGQIILTTLLMNFRHFLMSASLSQRMGVQPRSSLPLLAFGVTDEVFSVAMTRREALSLQFVGVLQLMAYLSWNVGTFLGYWLGDILPTLVQASLGIALYALFVAILLPEMRRSRQVMVLAVTAGLLHSLLSRLELLPPGWNLVAVIVLVSWWGTCLSMDTVSRKKENAPETFLMQDNETDGQSSAHTGRNCDKEGCEDATR